MQFSAASGAPAESHALRSNRQRYWPHCRQADQWKEWREQLRKAVSTPKRRRGQRQRINVRYPGSSNKIHDQRDRRLSAKRGLSLGEACCQFCLELRGFLSR